MFTEFLPMFRQKKKPNNNLKRQFKGEQKGIISTSKWRPLQPRIKRGIKMIFPINPLHTKIPLVWTDFWVEVDGVTWHP